MSIRHQKFYSSFFERTSLDMKVLNLMKNSILNKEINFLEANDCENQKNQMLLNERKLYKKEGIIQTI
jgi:hypothetical protein